MNHTNGINNLYKRLFLYLFIIFVLSCVVLEAKAQDLIAERAWFNDASAQMTLQDVQKENFDTYEGVLSKGFGTSAIWIRLTIDPTLYPVSALEPNRLMLRIRPVYLDQIHVYDPISSPGEKWVTGDWVHPSTHEPRTNDFLLTIPRGTEAREIWLRLESTSTRQISIQALGFDDWLDKKRQQQLLFAFYLAVVVVIALWAWTYWAFVRERLIMAFALSQTAAIGFAAGSLGFFRQWWPLDWSAQALNHTVGVTGLVAVSTAILFNYLLLNEFKPKVWARRLLQIFLLWQLVKLGFYVLGYTRFALNANFIDILLLAFVFLLAAITAQGWQKQLVNALIPRWVVLSYYTLICVILLVAALPGLALGRGGEIPLFIVQAHGLMTALLILLMLQYRAFKQRELQKNSEVELERRRYQSRIDQEALEDQARLFAMLTHELKTPMAAIAMRADDATSTGLKIQKAVASMSQVLDRCNQSIQLSEHRLVLQTQDVDLKPLLLDVLEAQPVAHRVELRCDAAQAIKSDGQLLKIILSNLLQNALLYSPADSVVELTAQTQSEHGHRMLSIEVVNDVGECGIPELDKVFEKYYRGPSAMRYSGTGLGLYLVKSLTETLSGSVNIKVFNNRIHFLVDIPCQS